MRAVVDVRYGLPDVLYDSKKLVVPTHERSRSIAMDSSSAFAPAVLQRWRRRENLLPGLALMALAAVGWAYVAYQAASMGSMQSAAMGGMEMRGIGEEAALFFLVWTAMMVAMMVPATLPLILLYRTIARNRLSLLRARAGVVMVLLG